MDNKNIFITEKEFDNTVEQTLSKIKELLVTKGKEYRRNKDVYHNFRQGSKKTANTMFEVLDGFQLKHDISVADIIEDFKKDIPTSHGKIEEKMNDILVYTLIKKIMMFSTNESVRSTNITRTAKITNGEK